jgi:ankyrin repeat protein
MKVAWYLVNEGADVFTVNKSQQNLLCVLFFNPNPDITLLKYLVSKGVSISQQDTFGEPALHKAIAWQRQVPWKDYSFPKHQEFVQYLLENGADPLQETKYGKTALSLVCSLDS